MQKELKVEFWTKISEISFQFTRRKCACSFNSHQYPER